MSDWLIVALLVVAVFGWMWIAGSLKYRRASDGLAARRGNLSKEQFVAVLAVDCEADIASFLWDELQPYWKPGLSPHPDDDFLKDLPIDHDEPNDWLAHFCKLEGLKQRDWPDWQQSSPSTVRNFARWLSEGRIAQRASDRFPADGRRL